MFHMDLTSIKLFFRNNICLLTKMSEWQKRVCKILCGKNVFSKLYSCGKGQHVNWIVDRLIASGQDWDFLFYVCVSGGDVHNFRRIIRGKSDIVFLEIDQRSILIKNCCEGNIEIIDYYLDHYFYRWRYGLEFIILAYAIREYQIDIAKLIMRKCVIDMSIIQLEHNSSIKFHNEEVANIFSQIDPHKFVKVMKWVAKYNGDDYRIYCRSYIDKYGNDVDS
jgi:hypothetical protein